MVGKSRRRFSFIGPVVYDKMFTMPDRQLRLGARQTGQDISSLDFQSGELKTKKAKVEKWI